MTHPSFAVSKPMNFTHRRAFEVGFCRRSATVTVTRRVLLVSQRELDPLRENPLGPPKVLCVGEVLYDLMSSSPTADISDHSQWSRSPGGGPANVAAGLAKLGTASAFIGNVGDDQLGDDLISALKEYKVNVDGMLKVPGRATREVFVRRNESGERAFVGFRGANDQFADTCALDPDTVPGVLFYAAQVLTAATLSLAFPGSARALQELVELAKLCKLQVVVDVNWRPVFWNGMAADGEARSTILKFLKKADIVKISIEEVEFLYGADLANVALQQPKEVLSQLGGDVKGALITAGRQGSAFVFDTGGQISTGQISARVPEGGVVDTTGAGDAFLAGFLSEMLRVGGFNALTDSEKVKNMATFGAEVASFVIAAPGAMEPQPTRDMMESARRKQVT